MQIMKQVRYDHDPESPEVCIPPGYQTDEVLTDDKELLRLVELTHRLRTSLCGIILYFFLKFTVL